MGGHSPNGGAARHALAPSLIAGAGSLSLYWLTAHPTITWWDSAQYTTAAATLGSELTQLFDRNRNSHTARSPRDVLRVPVRT